MDSEADGNESTREHRWRWEWREFGAIEWIAPAPGQLGGDGGTVTVSPPSFHPGRCSHCGRRAHVRVAFLSLPVCTPLFGPVGQGCSRAHATAAIAENWSTWADVAAAYETAARQVRERPGASEWDERTARYYEEHRRYAKFLAAAPSDSARRLALQLWEGDPPRLSVADTEVIIAGVFTEPQAPPTA